MFFSNVQSTGEFDNLGGPKPNDLAAIQVSPNSADWILAKVISHDTETGMYNLSDEDVESNKGAFCHMFAWAFIHSFTPLL